jgi:hypothetical protein
VKQQGRALGESPWNRRKQGSGCTLYGLEGKGQGKMALASIPIFHPGLGMGEGRRGERGYTGLRITFPMLPRPLSK